MIHIFYPGTLARGQMILPLLRCSNKWAIQPDALPFRSTLREHHIVGIIQQESCTVMVRNGKL